MGSTYPWHIYAMNRCHPIWGKIKSVVSRPPFFFYCSPLDKICLWASLIQVVLILMKALWSKLICTNKYCQVCFSRYARHGGLATFLCVRNALFSGPWGGVAGIHLVLIFKSALINATVSGLKLSFWGTERLALTMHMVWFLLRHFNRHFYCNCNKRSFPIFLRGM